MGIEHSSPLSHGNDIAPRELGDLVGKGLCTLLDFANDPPPLPPRVDSAELDEEGYCSTALSLSTLNKFEIALLMSSNLLEEKLANCCFDDAFVNTINRRICVLKSAYQIMLQAEDTALSKQIALQISETSVVYPRALAEMQLGVEAVYSLLAYTSTFALSMDRRFLDELAPLLRSLKPLQLKSGDHRIATEVVQTYTSKRSNMVVDSLRDSLYHVVLTDANDMRIRSNATDALISLTSARGRMSDMLVVVHLLLRAGTCFTDCSVRKVAIPDIETGPRK